MVTRVTGDIGIETSQVSDGIEDNALSTALVIDASGNVAVTGTISSGGTNVVMPNSTNNLSVGYTTDVYTYTAGTTLTPDTTQPYIGTMSVTGNLTINEIADGNEGAVVVFLTADASGPYTVTLGSGVSKIGTLLDLAPSSTYKTVIVKVSDSLTTVEMVKVG